MQQEMEGEAKITNRVLVSLRGRMSRTGSRTAPGRVDHTPLAACGLAHGAEVAFGAPRPARDRLTVVGGPLAPTTVALGGPLLLGRGRGCGLVLGHPTVVSNVKPVLPDTSFVVK